MLPSVSNTKAEEGSFGPRKKRTLQIPWKPQEEAWLED